jgi:predicted ATPase
MTAGLLGRRAELKAIEHSLIAARAGQARALALVGEPGIGKSRLAMEAALIAASEGFLPIWGRAWEAGC